MQKAFDQLRMLLENRQPVMVYTKYRNYPDMVLTDYPFRVKRGRGIPLSFLRPLPIFVEYLHSLLMQKKLELILNRLILRRHHVSRLQKIIKGQYTRQPQMTKQLPILKIKRQRLKRMCR
ncbi:hypothetical protein [Pragia fontium]|uniref:hypothetical protein n=1 Tax=Pragia fontium TaxID=82985 RepID=UPI0035A667A7